MRVKLRGNCLRGELGEAWGCGEPKCENRRLADCRERSPMRGLLYARMPSSHPERRQIAGTFLLVACWSLGVQDVLQLGCAYLWLHCRDIFLVAYLHLQHSISPEVGPLMYMVRSPVERILLAIWGNETRLTLVLYTHGRAVLRLFLN